MFTGIITHTGKVKKNTGSRLSIQTGLAKALRIGDSLSVNGVCLTAASVDSAIFTAGYINETAKRTTLADLEINDQVNLELPATPSTFLSGHIVQGHVDGVATLAKIEKTPTQKLLHFKIKKPLAKYLVDKGSVTLDGISLTIIKAGTGEFSVGIIPYTWNNTTFGKLRAGDKVNVEVDALAKYAEKLLIRKS